MRFDQLRATTVLCVRRGKSVAMGSDGQVTLGQSIIAKSTARKVQLLRNKTVLAGLAGSTADALMLMEMFEKKLDAHQGRLRRAAEELAKAWRTDRSLRRLEAELAVANSREMYLLSGGGDVIEPDNQIVAIGSGMGYALAAARALHDNTKLDAETIVRKALGLAAELCIYTNDQLTVHVIEDD